MPAEIPADRHDYEWEDEPAPIAEEVFEPLAEAGSGTGHPPLDTQLEEHPGD